ncbi:hypothetical protein PVAG01_00018 [Phlyctema vagabunda]|uniref:AB hydrolase-1 domain-containing protein n=1 Tax=Phlyctema vagabunda TaxID=108571 RepID=A0ABR4PT23_9HELO
MAAATAGTAIPAVPLPSPSPPQPQELESRAKEYIAQEKYNRRFTLPATDAHDVLTVTYAVAGVDSDTAPTVLFITGLFGGRLLASMMDYLGQSLGMRVVVVDRPGMGGSTMVDISLRLAVWLEMVPVLMRTINAQHLSVAAHSCGVVYALNTIYELPWILPPSNRKLYLFSPWVSLDHSILSIASYLPSPLVNQFDSLVRFITSTMTPALQFSGAVSSAVSPPSSDRSKPLPRHERDEPCRQYCGISAAEYAARSKAVMQATFKGSTRGANHEALLLLRRGLPDGWGACDDYKTYPDLLEAKMRGFSQRTGTRTSEETGASDSATMTDPFMIQTFWADKDNLIKKTGEAYFDECFERSLETHVGSGPDEGEHRYLSYESEVVPETNHDTVLLPQYGALPRAFRDMLGQRREDEHTR